jgi:peptide deformylase
VAIIPIRQLGDPVLRQRAKSVADLDAAMERLAMDMIETMYEAPGVGLAAPQVGYSLRLIVFDDGSGSGARTLVNPEVSDLAGEEIIDEGCLSIRGPYAPTSRATRVRVRGRSVTGEPVAFEAEGLLARIMQHEVDHLEGKLFIDRIDAQARREVMRQLREREVAGEEAGQRFRRP